MRKILNKAVFPALLAMILYANAEAKRLPPAEVNPVEKGGVQYRAPHWGITEGKSQNGRVIEAWDIKQNKRLWSLRVYKTEVNPAKERDVQEVFITSLAIQGNELHVRNELGDEYLVDVRTRRTKRVAETGTGKK